MNETHLNSFEFWNLFCNTVFDYHEKEIVKLDKQQLKLKYLEELSELETKIYGVFKLGGVVSPELVLHEDFSKVWEFFKNKL